MSYAFSQLPAGILVDKRASRGSQKLSAPEMRQPDDPRSHFTAALGVGRIAAAD
jgi:hypothetical protein